MQELLKGYEPARVLEHFAAISAIPRGSGSERAVSDYVAQFGRSLGLRVEQDELCNLVIYKPGSAGHEQAPPVMLQGHLDMVCEKNGDTVHNFETQGIELAITDGWLHAKGTTLGADNGVAVAMAMAVLEDKSLVHPPLECVFTVEEETGLTGAAMLDGGLLSARRMVNLDSEEEGVATVSCAGGLRLHLSRACAWQPIAAGSTVLQVQVGGLKGGHSGADIHLERGNANLVMGRLLDGVLSAMPLLVCQIEGGNKDNAIPRECTAVVAVGPDADAAQAKDCFAQLGAVIAQEFEANDPGLWVRVEEVQASRAMSAACGRALVDLLLLVPNGPITRNVKAGGFVVSSSNLGILRTTEQEVFAVLSMRSSQDTQQAFGRRRAEQLAQLLGFETELHSAYPGWAYAEQSALRETVGDCYRKQTGTEMRFEAIHAGLECGLFAGKLPGLDAVALGPQMHGVHTPEERLNISSCARTYQLLCAVLAAL